VALGHDHALVDGGLARPAVHLQVDIAGNASGVDEQEHQPQRVGAYDIAANQLAPGAHHRFRHLRVAVTRQVDNVKPSVHQVEVNGLGLSGSLAHACHGFSIEDGV